VIKLRAMSRIREYLVECRRILRIAKKPERTELNEVLKICGIGIIVIGFIGFFTQTLLYFLSSLIGSVELAVIPTIVLLLSFIFLVFRIWKE